MWGNHVTSRLTPAKQRLSLSTATIISEPGLDFVLSWLKECKVMIVLLIQQMGSLPLVALTAISVRMLIRSPDR